MCKLLTQLTVGSGEEVPKMSRRGFDDMGTTWPGMPYLWDPSMVTGHFPLVSLPSWCLRVPVPLITRVQTISSPS